MRNPHANRDRSCGAWFWSGRLRQRGLRAARTFATCSIIGISGARPSFQPAITSIAPNTVSTAGSAWGTIIGLQFQPGATVTLEDSNTCNLMRSISMALDGIVDRVFAAAKASNRTLTHEQVQNIAGGDAKLKPAGAKLETARRRGF